MFLTIASTADLAFKFSAGLGEIIQGLYGLAPSIGIGVFVFAGVIYAGGQVFDASTRQKAQAWSMSMVTGTIVGMAIIVLAPFVINFLLGLGGA